MKLNKILGLLLLLLFAVSSVNAIDYDNVTFTSEEFLGTAINAAYPIQINETHIAIVYIKSTSSTLSMKNCLNNGTSCSSETALATGISNIAPFLDTTNNVVIIPYATTSGSGTLIRNFDGSLNATGSSFNTGQTTGVGAVQSNSTHFAVFYRDTADLNHGTINICPLDGTSCGTETDVITTGVTQYPNIIKNSNDLLTVCFYQSTNGVCYERTLTGGTSSGPYTFNTGSSLFIDILEGSDNKLKIAYGDGTDGGKLKFVTCDLNGDNCASEITLSIGQGYYAQLVEPIGSDKLAFMYRDTNNANYGTMIFSNLTGGDISNNNVFSTVTTNELNSMYTNSDVIITAYKDSTNSKGMFAISEAFPSGAVVTINTPTEAEYLTSTTFSFNVSTDLATDLTYSLNGASNVSLGTNITSSVSDILGIEGSNTIIVYSNLSGEVTDSGLRTFTIDSTNPTITNNIPATSEVYEFSGSWFSCTDTNIASCNISINGLNEASGLNFSLTNNGNLSYNITAIDLAGNSLVEAGNLYVNPRIYFSFNDSGTLIDTYTFGGRADVSGLVNYTIYNDGLILGNNTLSFAKLGYITQDFEFLFNTTTAINYTFDVSPAVININVYDRLTGSLLTNNISLELVGSVGDSTTTTTGTATLQAINGTAGDYQVIATSTGLETESVYFTFSTQENVTLNIYMFNASYINLGVVNIEVKDNLGQFIEGATAEALEWKSSESAYISVAQCQTGTNGQCSLNVELNNALYKFRATKNTITHLTNQQILTVTDTTITIVLQDTVLTITPNLNQLLSEFTEAVNNVTNVSLTRFEWVDSEGVVSQACITTYRDTGYSLSQLAQNCTSATSGVLFASNFINNTYPITIVATVIYDGITYPIGQFSHIGEDSIVTALEESGLDLFVPIVFFFIAIALGIMFGNVYAALALVIALQWIAVGIAPRVMNGTIAVIITLIALLIGWGVNRK